MTLFIFIGEIEYIKKWYITVLEDAIQQQKVENPGTAVKADLPVRNFILRKVRNWVCRCLLKHREHIRGEDVFSVHGVSIKQLFPSRHVFWINQFRLGTGRVLVFSSLWRGLWPPWSSILDQWLLFDVWWWWTILIEITFDTTELQLQVSQPLASNYFPFSALYI